MPPRTAAERRPPDAANAPGPPAPHVSLSHLDALWFQVTGTICNLRCTHCFISCSPENHSFEFLSLDEVTRGLAEGERRGVKEYYFTGGEPFMHVDLPEMVRRTLAVGPATILTNGTLLPDRMLVPIARAAAASRYSLEIRVSIDGPSAEINDPVRGAGTFDRAMAGVRKLLDHGLLPIVTATQVWNDARDEDIRRGFVDALRAIGYERPRLKILPSLRIGREAARDRGYGEHERVTPEMLDGYDETQLLCASSRIVTNRGVWACPILIDHGSARVGDTLDEAHAPVALEESACYTCWLYGAICSNYGGIGSDVG